MSIQKLFLFGVAILCGTIAIKSANNERRYELDVKDFSELRVIEGLSVDYKYSADSAGYEIGRASCRERVYPVV